MPNTALADVLASYVPRLIQTRIVANPTPIESPDAEDFQAAILFADISGFTLLTERLAERGPTGVEALTRILNEYFGQLIDIIHEFGGDVVKFAGDAVIAALAEGPRHPAADRDRVVPLAAEDDRGLPDRRGGEHAVRPGLHVGLVARHLVVGCGEEEEQPVGVQRGEEVPAGGADAGRIDPRAHPPAPE